MASIFAATAAKSTVVPKYGESGLIALFVSAAPANAAPNRWRITIKPSPRAVVLPSLSTSSVPVEIPDSIN